MSFQMQQAVSRIMRTSHKISICSPTMYMLPMRMSSSLETKRGLILGMNTSKKSEDLSDKITMNEGTSLFEQYNAKWKGKLSELLNAVPPLKTGQARTFHGFNEEFSSLTLVGLGPADAEFNKLECIDERRENTRLAIAAGIKGLKESGVDEVFVDTSVEPHAAAEGALLSTWCYKESDRKKFPAIIKPSPLLEEPLVETEWERGRIYAECQNWARHLMESPANLMTPTDFSRNVEDMFSKCETSGSLTINIRDKSWIENESMGAFLSVAQGSDQPPKFVEIHYKSQNTAATRPLILVGKGVTFDSGGVSIKPSKGMEEMRADMGGASVVVSAMLAAAKLNTPGNIVGLIPLCENMLNGKANKPGDVVKARNGTTIQVDNTDAEGRLLLADALCYAQDKFQPAAVLDAATLTGAMVISLGASAVGTFSNDEQLWNDLHEAGIKTGDRMWRMPLFDLYSNQVKPAHLADINNVGKGGGAGGSCTAAAFLRHFIKKDTRWAHMDIAGVMSSNGSDIPYLATGMSGRPTRTLVEFLSKFNYET